MKKWTTRDGQKIPILKMTNQHLLNTIQMLRRVHREEVSAMYSAASSLSGEMASYYADMDIDRAEREESWHPLYGDLMEEANRRHLFEQCIDRRSKRVSVPR